MYSLYKIGDSSCGDSGNMSMSIYLDEETNTVKVDHDSKPRVGGKIRVGSLVARAYSSQDYWTTNIITEIIEETENYVRFSTLSGSIYEWKNNG